MVYASIRIAFLWLLFVELWLVFYAGDFSIWQNIGIVIVSLAVVAILETAIWLPWRLKDIRDLYVTGMDRLRQSPIF